MTSFFETAVTVQRDLHGQILKLPTSHGFAGLSFLFPSTTHTVPSHPYYLNSPTSNFNQSIDQSINQQPETAIQPSSHTLHGEPDHPQSRYFAFGSPFAAHRRHQENSDPTTTSFSASFSAFPFLFRFIPLLLPLHLLLHHLFLRFLLPF